MNENRIKIPKPQGHHCFACGTANPIGLNLQFYEGGDGVFTEIILEKNHEGWENVAHGGIVSTLLDETMSWAVMYAQRQFIVTRNMSIKYIRPVLIGIPIIVQARVESDSEPPKVQARAEVRDPDGRLLVRGKGEFVALPREKLPPSIPDGLVRDMAALFESFSRKSEHVTSDKRHGRRG